MLKKTLAFIAIAAIFLIPIFPLFPTPFWPLNFSNDFFFPFITGKAFYFRILAEIAFAAWLVLAFFDPKYRPKLNRMTLAITVFTLVALVADLLGVNPVRSLWSNFERMEGWMTIVHLWAFYMATTGMFGTGEEARRWWHRLFNMTLAVACIVGIYGFVQLAGGADIHQGSRIDASLGNAAYMAVYMLLDAGLAAYMFFVSFRRKPRPTVAVWVYGILFAAFSFLLFETATRGTILGWTGGAMLGLFVYAVFGKHERRNHRLIAAGALTAIILVGAIFWINKNAAFVQNNEVLRRLASISWSDTSNQARQYIWPMAVNGALERPIFGWGQENFNYIFNANYNPKMWSQEQWFDRAHNVFLDWLVAGGIIGLISYLALYVYFLRAVWKSSLTMAEKSVLTGLLAGYAVHNIFVFDNLASYVLFFLALGFASTLLPQSPIRFLGTKPMRQDAVEYIVLPIAVVAFAAIFYMFQVRPLEANTRMITALESCNSPSLDVSLFDKALAVNTYVANQEIREQILTCGEQALPSPQLPGPTKQALYNLALQQINTQTAVTPKDARIYTLASSFLNSIGQFQTAVKYAEQAHALSPAKQSIDLELATDYLDTGKAPQAVALLKSAYESAMDNTQVRLAYAVALVVSGNEAGARQIFGNDPQIWQSVQMGQAYATLKQYGKAIAIYQALAAKNPTDLGTSAQLAQLQYQSGQPGAAIITLRTIENNHPELKDQIEAAIKQVEAGQK